MLFADCFFFFGRGQPAARVTMANNNNNNHHNFIISITRIQCLAEDSPTAATIITFATTTDTTTDPFSGFYDILGNCKQF